MLQRAIYVSDAAGAQGSTILSMALILGASDANNRRDHVTGMLIYHRGQFMQVIEGARVDIDRLMKRLRADVRHGNIRMLLDGSAHDRRFGSAPMAQVPVEGAVADILGDRMLDALSLSDAEALFTTGVIQSGMAA
ncbi:BLUF domain-containing protein [Brevundimonas sp.]|uniref:BLUF domain-containing protein n=1 Tax=Brevundimonas sp. TaxID=1871086 RepID=UPI003BABE94D